ncbi:MAG TPA: peptide chain release factor N(5)-glutamine methyltransferase [Candidatus Binatia bacterium]|nr:peptide chain release factor N(5)-glutamine methyltransferase [Candidatus Binatia bacterium]
MEVQNAASEPLTSGRALFQGIRILRDAGVASAQTDAEVLLRHVLKIDRAELYSHLDAPLGAERERQLQGLLVRRARREPVAYITGQKEFWSLDFLVTPDVLIPRPETELVVEIALECLRSVPQTGSTKILDLGTGSGVIAVCLARELAQAEIVAVDISSRALDVARRNSARHGVANSVRFVSGNLFRAIAGPKEKFALIVSNPPYVRRSDLAALAPEIRDWEPMTALDGGADGLDFYRWIVQRAGRHLEKGGRIVLEIGAGTGAAVTELFAATGSYGPASVNRDYAGLERVIVATKI